MSGKGQFDQPKREITMLMQDPLNKKERIGIGYEDHL